MKASGMLTGIASGVICTKINEDPKIMVDLIFRFDENPYCKTNNDILMLETPTVKLNYATGLQDIDSIKLESLPYGRQELNLKTSNEKLICQNFVIPCQNGQFNLISDGRFPE